MDHINGSALTFNLKSNFNAFSCFHVVINLQAQLCVLEISNCHAVADQNLINRRAIRALPYIRNLTEYNLIQNNCLSFIWHEIRQTLNKDSLLIISVLPSPITISLTAFHKWINIV